LGGRAHNVVEQGTKEGFLMKLLLFFSIDGSLLGKHREEQIAMGSKGAEQRRLGPGIGGQRENVVVNLNAETIILSRHYVNLQQFINRFLRSFLILLSLILIN
jgi:hypothetical protein